MNGWFLSLIIIAVLNIGINLAKHGEKRNDDYNVVTSIIGATIQLVLTYMAIKVGI